MRTASFRRSCQIFVVTSFKIDGTRRSSFFIGLVGCLVVQLSISFVLRLDLFAFGNRKCVCGEHRCFWDLPIRTSQRGPSGCRLRVVGVCLRRSPRSPQLPPTPNPAGARAGTRTLDRVFPQIKLDPGIFPHHRFSACLDTPLSSPTQSLPHRLTSKDRRPSA